MKLSTNVFSLEYFNLKKQKYKHTSCTSIHKDKKKSRDIFQNLTSMNKISN